MTAMHDEIQSWLRQSDTEFEERVKEEEQKYKETPPEYRLP